MNIALKIFFYSLSIGTIHDSFIIYTTQLTKTVTKTQYKIKVIINKK
jgi:hypothetical protein